MAYEIIIKNAGGGASESPISAGADIGDKTPKSASNNLGALKKVVSYGFAKSLVVKAVNHEVSLVELRTGSNELQQRADFINGAVQQAAGIVEMAVTGAVLGGGIVGAVVGATVGLLNTVIGIAQRQNTINMQRNVENISLQRQYVRAGARGSRGNE